MLKLRQLSGQLLILNILNDKYRDNLEHWRTAWRLIRRHVKSLSENGGSGFIIPSLMTRPSTASTKVLYVPTEQNAIPKLCRATLRKNNKAKDASVICSSYRKLNIT